MNAMNQPHPRLQEINALEAEAMRAARAGQDAEANRLWGRILQIDSSHGRTLTILGQRAVQRGDLETARAAYQRLVDSDGSDPRQWVNLALVCQNLGDEQAEKGAIERALDVDPMDLPALLLRGKLLEREGRTHEAARAYGAAAAVSPPLDRLHPDLRPAVAHAVTYRDKYNDDCARFLAQHLEPYYRNFAGEPLSRFRDSLDIMVGKKKRYDSRSELYHFPRLAPIEFFERGDFPWLDPIEAATDAIRDEFIALLNTEEGFTPYISYPQGVPHNQFAELNNSPRWSAFHLYKLGERVVENAAKCPITMAALEHAPKPDQPGRTPAAMFSLLKPRTRIPPHNGVTNTRLVTHLALIIPDGCRFRVGNDVRLWTPGKAWVFDDTIEHEASNDSDKLRVVLIFDIWHPHLTPPEREMITAMTAGLNAFHGTATGFEL
jgi:aspartyl/asparaginyl beta-hydroxylase (cupin superfamily)